MRQTGGADLTKKQRVIGRISGAPRCLVVVLDMVGRKGGYPLGFC